MQELPTDNQRGKAFHFPAPIILIVDDDPSQRDVLRAILSDEGFQAHVAASAEEALRAADSLVPDVVLTDLRMYKMDGIELTKELRARADTPEVIIMSAFGTPVIIEEAKARGASSFMKKPFDKSQVLFCINQALEIAARVKSQKV